MTWNRVHDITSSEPRCVLILRCFKYLLLLKPELFPLILSVRVCGFKVQRDSEAHSGWCKRGLDVEETERKPVTVMDKNYVKAAARFTGSVKCSLCTGLKDPHHNELNQTGQCCKNWSTMQYENMQKPQKVTTEVMQYCFRIRCMKTAQITDTWHQNCNKWVKHKKHMHGIVRHQVTLNCHEHYTD